ncbi:MAG: hypothetical protein N2445_02780, partial [Acidobacteria bacterium]|nr:hypothetical protein [Acidobacteriota bacterium]
MKKPIICKRIAPVDESQNGPKMKPVPQNRLYRIPSDPLEMPKRLFENNCYLRVLKGVVKFFCESFSKEALNEMVKHISREETGFNLRDARKWLEPLEIDDIIETNVSIDRLRIAIKNKIPTVLIFKAPFDFSYDLKIKHKIKKGVKPNGAPFKYSC